MLQGLIALVLLTACAAPTTGYTTIPVDTTPYDLRMEQLNRRLCEERRGRWERTTLVQGNVEVVVGGLCHVTP